MNETSTQRQDIEDAMTERGMVKRECVHCKGRGLTIKVTGPFKTVTRTKILCRQCNGEGFNWIQPPKINPPAPILPRTPSTLEKQM